MHYYINTRRVRRLTYKKRLGYERCWIRRAKARLRLPDWCVEHELELTRICEKVKGNVRRWYR